MNFVNSPTRQRSAQLTVRARRESYLNAHLQVFALEAARFEKWATESRENGASSARQALVRITNLYMAALRLPPAWADDVENKSDCPRLEKTENSKIVAYSAIPFDMYAEVFDPLIIPPEEPVIGSIVDDVIDIYRDVVTGLRAFEGGDMANARWEWGFNFAHHWGEHATGAIRALHAWLAANAVDELAEMP